MADLEAQSLDPFSQAIAAVVARQPQPFFLQIGGFDGESFDPLRPHIVAHDLAGLIAEPIPQYFEKLQALYAGNARVVPVNAAITEADGARTIWRFNPAAVEKGLLPPHFAGISSFVMEDLLSETGVLGRSSPDPASLAVLRRLLQPVAVKCRTLDSLLREFGVTAVDILQIGTEGYDFIILKLFDFDRFRPAIVHYEHQHLSMEDRLAALRLLEGRGYRMQIGEYATLAVLDPVLTSAQVRAPEALAVLEHLNASVPDDAETLTLLVTAQMEGGCTLEALQTIAALRTIASDTPEISRRIGVLKAAAFDRYNAHIAAGETAQAELYIAALAVLLPTHKNIREAAFLANLVLARTEPTIAHAIALLSLNEKHGKAWEFVANIRRSRETSEMEIAQRLAVVSGQSYGYPLLRLRDLHHAASAILCAPQLEARHFVLLQRIQDVAKDLDAGAPPGGKWAIWEKHYRMPLEAIDLPALQAAAPPPLSEEPAEFLTASGVSLDWAGVIQAAAHLDPRLVFFVAADETYVTRYARWYALSVLKHADVPFVIVIHVIGGAGKLAEIARTIGINDARLIFAGDAFDAGAVTTICHDMPNGPTAKPIAHYQSARFIKLGALLAHLRRPVLVSDIDIVLQRGVADLVQTCAGADVVFNENWHGLAMGDRLTANLLLVNPTPNAALFLRFLRDYLKRQLSKPEVGRWIDQSALLIARHYLYGLENPRPHYFDPNTDINNVMYESYRENPYRFLSLYQTFDPASLVGVFGEDSAA